uniref:Uncharacterized protein n=1 Tax=Anguilla anguilla TaxID=7936 RepID=A0A0E9TN38_ANGAN
MQAPLEQSSTLWHELHLQIHWYCVGAWTDRGTVQY